MISPLQHPVSLSLPRLLKGFEVQKVNAHDPVDLVITWVNKEDREWKISFKKQMGIDPPNNRYGNNDELELCLASVNRFMPWLRTIHLVTDCKVPKYVFAYPKIKIISQNSIFDEKVSKPSFNSIVIESYCHKIPHLSETFLVANDDFIVGRPNLKTSWFSGGLPLCPLRLTPLKNNRNKPFWWYYYNALRFIGNRFGVYPGEGNKCFNNTHQFSIMRKTTMETAWQFFPRSLYRTVQSKDRTPAETQVLPYLLSQLLGSYTGTMIIKPERGKGLHDYHKYMGHNFMPHEVAPWLQTVWNNTPDFYCINVLHNPQNQREFQQFKRHMLRRIRRE